MFMPSEIEDQRSSRVYAGSKDYMIIKIKPTHISVNDENNEIAEQKIEQIND